VTAVSGRSKLSIIWSCGEANNMMKAMKRYLIQILVISLLALGLAGCSATGSQSSSKEFRSATDTVQVWLKEIRGDYGADSEYLGIWRVQRPDNKNEAFFYSMRAAIRTQYGQNFNIDKVWVQKELGPHIKLVAFQLSGNGRQGTHGLWVYTETGAMWAIYGTSDETPPSY